MFYRQPNYFNDFKCVGGTCTNSCCIGWCIDWSEKEIDKIKNAPKCSPELKELCEKSFMYDEKRKKYVVILEKTNRCPFLTEDNFCKIQKELGAEYLGVTCTIYPRHYLKTGFAIYRHCNMTCPEIMNKLLNDDQCMNMINMDRKSRKPLKIGSTLDSRDNLAKHPEQKYAGKIIEFFYEIISDKELPLESCIILGALVAQSLTKLVEAKQYDRIPEAITSLKAQMRNPEQLKSIKNIKPNYNVKLGVTDKLIREFASSRTVDTFIDGDGKPNIDFYNRAELLLDKQFESRQFAWRNIALNLLLELNVPFKLAESTILENYSVFVMSYVFLRYSALTVESHNDKINKEYDNEVSDSGNTIKLKFKVRREIDTEDYIIRFGATLSRFLCHNDERLKSILQRLKDLGMTSPAYLALLVK